MTDDEVDIGAQVHGMATDNGQPQDASDLIPKPSWKLVKGNPLAAFLHFLI